MESIKTLKITIEDIKLLQEIGKRTFAETFSSDNSEEDMKKYLNDKFSIKALKTEFADKNVEFYFAKLERQIIGYLKINFGDAQTEIKDENAIEIERIYVLKEFHGKKVGQLLCNKAIQVATLRKVDYIWLGVWEENQKAIRFYKKNGFVEFSKHIFKLGNDEQTDIMMKLEID